MPMTPLERDRAATAGLEQKPTAAVLDLASAMTQERITLAPGVDVYVLIEQQLDFMRGFEAVGVDPSESDRERISIGVIAVRNFDDVDPEYSRVLCEAAYRFQEGVGPR